MIDDWKTPSNKLSGPNRDLEVPSNSVPSTDVLKCPQMSAILKFPALPPANSLSEEL